MFITTGIVLGLILSGCSGGQEKSAEEQSLMSDSASLETEISEEAINAIIESMPAPMEISASLKASGAEYNPNLLNPVSEADRYTTAAMKAFGLGRYGADLAYINIYEKPSSAFNYLNVIRKLADDLMVGPFFDFNTLKRLSESNRNMDSLLYISTTNFNEMDRHLREKKRGNLSVLMVAGAWLEGAYISSTVAVEKKQKDIIEKVGEQKVILDQLLIILGAFKKDEYFRQLTSDFSDLQKAYQGVDIKTEYREPGSKEENGKLVIVDNSITTITVPDSTLSRIHTIISAIRNRQSSSKP
jgi:predicted CopG family antitoxin